MIQVDQALSIIAENSCKMPIRKIKVTKSLGFILAEAIYSPMDMPPFRQSAMDGYAFTHSELQQFNVVSTSQAGDFSNKKIKQDQAIRIFTGAYVPDNLDTVVMQEHTTVKNKTVEITKMPARFANVRNKGEQIKENELVLENNTVITPAAIGFLACLGITEITVYAKPKVAIVVTGNELVKVGKKLPEGKIYESNSIMLESALQGIGIKKTEIFRVKDNLKATKRVLKSCLSTFDVVLVSGGISVGDYDFVKEALLSNGVEELFYKINQKPGKPLFFGKKDKTIVFALPGNPASTLTSFYIYVYPALKINMGFEVIHLPKIKRKINTQFENTSGKTLFLKGLYDDKKVTILESQSSAMLNTFAVANALIYLPYDVVNIEKDQEVMVVPLN
ncbi:molybdopterin molybdotransferase MoeA [Flavobacterium gawalongense]|uniref:Molybdopterin molybdenumtransferase n=1 Tax=Flavobacterium gawalongense TaxID=2594432 RepID=A0A553BCH1_9FLAO|nr:gephyrin-like molybdotransferase Glp [Flavobacterium gawalongense]TRX00290.1 molybdopterin molybdotransferase MoeA [Flavobacterium gawalongense]TRX05407.1 molybdopterin molybdotransferase MoeA [Flavobacterium gawalongense]TRX05951.1 molybdopterin molybdotransferase MoeA [Flavobacterium gawalongense]TRX10263.1 molybdopterin molybdotransferase MoeA [Flavobacterium gawalongense]TRX27728.1 molybdopterin molybdotransferase MoeA [Flavobacterium gawalongense]